MSDVSGSNLSWDADKQKHSEAGEITNQGRSSLRHEKTDQRVIEHDMKHSVFLKSESYWVMRNNHCNLTGTFPYKQLTNQTSAMQFIFLVATKLAK